MQIVSHYLENKCQKMLQPVHLTLIATVDSVVGPFCNFQQVSRYVSYREGTV